jgi:hypothetical protein
MAYVSVPNELLSANPADHVQIVIMKGPLPPRDEAAETEKMLKEWRNQAACTGVKEVALGITDIGDGDPLRATWWFARASLWGLMAKSKTTEEYMKYLKVVTKDIGPFVRK